MRLKLERNIGRNNKSNPPRSCRRPDNRKSSAHLSDNIRRLVMSSRRNSMHITIYSCLHGPQTAALILWFFRKTNTNRKRQLHNSKYMVLRMRRSKGFDTYSKLKLYFNLDLVAFYNFLNLNPAPCFLICNCILHAYCFFLERHLQKCHRNDLIYNATHLWNSTQLNMLLLALNSLHAN